MTPQRPAPGGGPTGAVRTWSSASSALNEISVQMHRTEAAVLAGMPQAMPVPRRRGVVEVDGVDWGEVSRAWLGRRLRAR